MASCIPCLWRPSRWASGHRPVRNALRASPKPCCSDTRPSASQGGVLFPMKPREALAAGEEKLRNVMHIPATVVMSLFIVLAMGFGATLLGKRFRYYSYGTVAMLLVFGTLASLQAGKMAANEPTPWMGIEERINIYATMLWVAVLATGLLRAQKAR